MNESPKQQTFGGTLFSGSPFIFWCLGPLFLLIALVFVGVAVTQFASGRYGAGGIAVAVALICGCFFLALLNGPYFWWAGRVVAASVFAAYLWFLLDTWLIHPKPFEIGGKRSSATPWSAICGLVIIGWPCLCYTFLGRFTLRPPAALDSTVSSWDREVDETDDKRPHTNDRNG